MRRTESAEAGVVRSIERGGRVVGGCAAGNSAAGNSAAGGREAGGREAGGAAFGASRSSGASCCSGASRFGAVAAFVRQKLGGCRHELRVACLSGRLFQQTRHLHGLSRAELTTLRLGALLHDIGRYVDDEDHPELGARLILRSRQLPLTPRERRLAAFLARYHRGAVPDTAESEAVLAEEARTGRVLLALLRAADALDSRVDGHVHVGLRVRGERVEIVAECGDDRERARRAVTRRKKYRLLEECLGCRVRVRVA